MAHTPLDALESVRQLAEAWRVIVADRGSGDIRDRPGTAIRWADSKFPFWNLIAVTEQCSDPRLLDEWLAQAAAYMRQKSQRGALWLFEELLDPSCLRGLPAAIERAGLVLSDSGFGIAGDILPIPEPAHPRLEFVRVRTQDELQAYADINSRAYGFALESGRDGLNGSELWTSEEMHAYLGVEGGTPVSTAATIRVNGSLFLVAVATTPEAQRKGYGEAVSRKALFEGARATGLTRTVFQASLAGAPVYERIGCHKAATLRFYGLRT